jgi:GntR family histidine utilization transcriptional repressor
MSASGRSIAVTLHDRIRRDIEAHIVRGDWPPGYRIPFEHELTAEYRCSRMTVNKALSTLVQAGLIERRRRAGSFVTRPQVQSAVLTIPNLEAEVTARGQTYGFELVSRRRRRASAQDRFELGLAHDTDVLAVRCLHRAQEQPFAIEDRILNLAAVPDAANADFSAVPPGTWLLEHVPWSDAENRISAHNADRATADALAVPFGAACLLVTRRTWRADATITRVHLTFPGDRYQLVARFTPTNA